MVQCEGVGRDQGEEEALSLHTDIKVGYMTIFLGARVAVEYGLDDTPSASLRLLCPLY